MDLSTIAVPERSDAYLAPRGNFNRVDALIENTRRQAEMTAHMAGFNRISDLVASAQRQADMTARIAGYDRIRDLVASAQRQADMTAHTAGFNRISDLVASAQRQADMTVRIAGYDRINDLVASAQRQADMTARMVGYDHISALLVHTHRQVTLSNKLIAEQERHVASITAMAGFDRIAELFATVPRDLDALSSIASRRVAASLINVSPSLLNGPWFSEVTRLADLAIVEKQRTVLGEPEQSAEGGDVNLGSDSRECLITLEQLKEARKANRNLRYALYLTAAALAYPIIKDVIENQDTFIAYAKFLSALFLALAHHLGYSTSEIVPIEFYDI